MRYLIKIRRIWRIYGLFGAFQELAIRRSCWSVESAGPGANKSKTSISDATPYVRVCELAVADPTIFSKFRRCLEYRLILEHVTVRFGKKYLKIALKNSMALEYFKKIKLQNDIGNPVTFYFKTIGRTSPTTIRYLKVLCELLELFGPLDDFKISEIGVGFGGQAHAIAVNQNLKSYTLYDLPPVLKLTNKFLEELTNAAKFRFIDGRDPEPTSSDLLISNYAFSELTRKVQTMYLDKVISNAKMGYMTWTELSYKELVGYCVKEIISLIPGSRIIPEEPLTYPNNVIIVWGTK